MISWNIRNYFNFPMLVKIWFVHHYTIYLEKVPLVRPAAFQLNSVDKSKHTDILDVTAVWEEWQEGWPWERVAQLTRAVVSPHPSMLLGSISHPFSWPRASPTSGREKSTAPNKNPYPSRRSHIQRALWPSAHWLLGDLMPACKRRIQPFFISSRLNG